MSTENLKNPFDDDEDDLELLGTFKPTPKQDIKQKSKQIAAADKVSVEQGFTSRKQKPKPKMRRSAMYQTGRSQQIPIRGTVVDQARVDRLCNNQDWVKGQMLQYALDALEDKLKEPNDPFWETRNISGVE